MVCVNAHAKYTALKESDFKRRKIEIELKKLRKELEEAETVALDTFNKELKVLEIEENEYKLWIEEKLIKDAVIELKIYLEWLEKMIKDFGGVLTREKFDASEPEYWKRRAIRQSERAMICSGTIDDGNIELLQQIGMDPVKVKTELLMLIESITKSHLIEEEEKIKMLPQKSE
jgi:DNA-binding PucR family transcriptional regulator